MASSYVSVFLPAVQQLALAPLLGRIRKLTLTQLLLSFAAYGVPLADLITGQCTSFRLTNLPQVQVGRSVRMASVV